MLVGEDCCLSDAHTARPWYEAPFTIAPSPLLMIVQVAMETAPPPTTSLLVKALAKVREWAENRGAAPGIPYQCIVVPEHLRFYDGIYSEPSLWPSLYGIQHKDLLAAQGL